MVQALFLILITYRVPGNFSSFAKNIANDVQVKSKNVIEPSSLSKTNHADTLLSPIESLFIHITGKKNLKQVGYEVFKVYGGDYVNTQNLSPDYTLGPGDEITIYVSGSIENTFTSVVDKRGTIFVPGLGPVKIAGMSIKNAEHFLNQLANRKWSNVKIFISPGRIRGIKVYLTGEVQHPGAYVLKAKSTVLDLLFIAKGLLKTGTLRDIVIVHENGSKTSIDLYPFIFGGKPQDVELKDGDVVVVQPIKKVVAIEGAVYKPGIYEIKNTTSLAQLAKWAGIMPINQKRAILRRIEYDSVRIFDISHDQWKTFLLKDGDYVTIPVSKYIKKGYIYIGGNIKKPGYYTYKPELTLKKAIYNAGGFLYTPYREAIIVRHKKLSTMSIRVMLAFSDTFKLQDKDSILLFREDILDKKEPVSIRGYVEHPGTFKWHKDLSLKSLILLAKPRAEASLDHIIVFKRHEKQTKVILKQQMTSFFLDPGDVVYVPPDTFKTSFITVYAGGAVKYPGLYTLPAGSNVSYLLNLSGGFRENAYPAGIYIKRKIQSQHMYEKLSEFNLYILDSSARYLPDSLYSLLKSRILNKLPATLSTLLKNGDSLFVPTRTSFIYIAGATVQPHSLPYEKGLKLKDVIKKVPLLEVADKKNAFAVSINGKIHRDKLSPGDIVYIPFKKPKQSSGLKNLSYLSGLIYQFLATLFIIYQLKK